MPWYDILPDWLNPWATSPAPAAAPAPTEAPVAAAPPLGELGDLAPTEEAPARKPSDLVYLGLNDPSRAAEIAALPEGTTVVDGSAKQGTIMAADGKTELDLSKPAKVEQFLREAGVAQPRQLPDGSFEDTKQVEARMDALAKTFGSGIPNGVRDEMAELVQTLQKVESGDLAMERLIISGHHYEDEPGIHGPAGSMTFPALTALLSQFPEARAGVHDLMFSACNTVNGPQAQADQYRKMFPGLESTWGYNGIAPAPGADPKNSSPAHIAAWAEASQGDTAAVEEAARGRFRAKVARY